MRVRLWSRNGDRALDRAAAGGGRAARLRKVGLALAVCALGGAPAAIAAQTAVTRGPTVTTLSCQPSVVVPEYSTKCTATVTDTSPVPLTPTGAVEFRSDITTDIFTGSQCTLSGSGGVAHCKVTFRPDPGVDLHRLSAHYEGDHYHYSSVGKTQVWVQG